VIAIHSVPQRVVKSLASTAKNGWLLAATALAFGLVSAEEMISGKIACYNEAETRTIR